MEPWLFLIGSGTLMLMLYSHRDTASRMRRLEHKLNLLLQHQGVDVLEGITLSDRVKDLARDPSRKIEAIKLYREETGVGLADAKSAIEAFTNGL
jgi:hypothetical protein